jgi:acid stress-induced BolA-like protein IbaG/YrbA
MEPGPGGDRRDIKTAEERIVSQNIPLTEQIRQKIEAALPGAAAEVEGGGGHFSIVVVAEQFRGKSMLEQQRMVYSAINDLMRGIDAPVHAVDALRTRVP